MKVKTDQLITDLSNKPIKDTDGSELTLGDVLCNALMGAPQGEKLDGKESVKKYNLALRIHNNGEVELSAEEVVDLLKVVGSMYLPMVAGAVYHILDPTTKD